MRVPSSRKKSPLKATGMKVSSSKKTMISITIEDIFKTVDTTKLKKNDMRVREFSVRTEPTNKKSPIIKRRYYPLDIPSNIYEVLQAIKKIEEGIKGNNITTGANMFAYFSQCLEGEAKRQFELLKKQKSSLSVNALKTSTQQ